METHPPILGVVDAGDEKLDRIRFRDTVAFGGGGGLAVVGGSHSR